MILGIERSVPKPETGDESTGTVDVKALFALLEKQSGKCALTGRTLTPENCVLDHIEPRKRSGAHTIENCQLVVNDVNVAKGTLNNAEFIALCREVASHCDSERVDEHQPAG